MSKIEEKDERPASTDEQSLIRSAFANNEALLKSVRALFLGLPTTDAEKKLVKGAFAAPEMRKMIGRRFMPLLDKDAPIGQAQDVWLGAEQMVFGYPAYQVKQAIQYKDMAIGYVRTALGLLDDPNGKPPPVLTYDASADDESGTLLLARNMYIRTVEQQLLFLWQIAQSPAKPAAPTTPGGKISGKRLADIHKKDSTQ
jgi:hypothetical protein